MRHFRSLLALKSIRMTPRRGRAKHGLVGPVYCFARTADEMLPVGPSRVAESLRKATKATGDSGLMRLACPGYLQRLSRGFFICHRSTARFEPDDEKRADGSRGPKTTQIGERSNSNAW
ncbi:MAG: hypothetical protein DWI00_09470 [Planctomycetota bacterium]|nr:MAG: hypothetical protein DWI00_09470 [Planctomycetota bacterium]